MTPIEQALQNATDTKTCVIGEQTLSTISSMFRDYFPGATHAIVVADPRTWVAAGETVSALLSGCGVIVSRHLIEEGGAHFHAEYRYVEEVRDAISRVKSEAGTSLVPVAVGSGVVNDLVKLASGDLGLPYLVVCTAPSVDGYSSFGASITSPAGAKQTYACPAPRAILADLDVLRTAPKEMTAWGYADLLAKVPAGADWILAAELGSAEWHDRAWHTVQDGLRAAIADPVGIMNGDPEPLRRFVEGLMLGGFAMQDMQASRPASGAEHMFSHILDMRHHTFRGELVSHGAQVGVATYFMTGFYERILAFDYAALDVEACLASWPDWPTEEALCRKLFEGTLFPNLGVEQTLPKYHDREALRVHLSRAKSDWPRIRARLAEQLLPASEIRRRLEAVGAPVLPEDIGTTPEAMLADTMQACHMRNRYNALDFTYRTGQMMDFARDVLSKQR